MAVDALLSDPIRAAVLAEGSSIDLENARRRLRAAGVVSVDLEEPPGGPRIAVWMMIGLGGHFECKETSLAPVGDALREMVDVVPKVDQLRRLLSACTDMEMAADGARILAEQFDEDDDRFDLPSLLTETIEIGVIVLYTRNYTGDARVHDRWRPEMPTDRALHDRLMVLRNSVVAHADWSEARTLVDTNKMLGIEGPPAIAEMRSRLQPSELIEIANLCSIQAERFTEATYYLKRDLGFPVA